MKQWLTANKTFIYLTRHWMEWTLGTILVIVLLCLAPRGSFLPWCHPIAVLLPLLTGGMATFCLSASSDINDGGIAHGIGMLTATGIYLLLTCWPICFGVGILLYVMRHRIQDGFDHVVIHLHGWIVKQQHKLDSRNQARERN